MVSRREKAIEQIGREQSSTPRTEEAGENVPISEEDERTGAEGIAETASIRHVAVSYSQPRLRRQFPQRPPFLVIHRYGRRRRGPRAAATASITDHAYKQAAVRSINSYLSSHNLPFHLSLKPLPSAKDITDTLRFVLSRLDFSVTKLEDDLPLLLKHLNCPIKLNKSALRAPGTPHAFPYLLAVINWLVQIADYNDHLSADESRRFSFLQDNAMMAYALNSYSHYMRGEDVVVEALDGEFVGKMEQERDSLASNVKSLENEIAELNSKLEGLKSGPSPREVLENDKKVLEEDVKKLQEFIGNLTDGIAMMDKALEEKEKELLAKVEENKQICEENEELKRRIDMQGINLRDAERMKRELQAVEREIGAAEAAHSAWEEKCWDLDATISQKFKELETLSIECNQALRRLKLGSDLQYALNAKGSTFDEVLGIDYKARLKPAIESFADEIKKSSMSNLEELIALQQQATEMTLKIEAKKKHIAALQSHIDEMEALLNFIRKETQEYSSRCAAEAQRMIENVEVEAHNLDSIERQAMESLKDAELKLQERTKQSEEEIQMSAYELWALIDSVSRYKEQMESKISEMKSNLSETAGFIFNAYKNALPAQFVASGTPRP
ncbi:hypothetical protein Nepgr_003116 [Nepenthes gracilis]|uniref:Kinetochore protein NDC80 n=1 Tax=Nepenthes gracilis TaxID=150966 RepID=A0AAD3RZ22_NEPGR|nr:hypothetical protein Nepgr_003116 [Nepenthes gracilis]